jgi:hypothetical protein
VGQRRCATASPPSPTLPHKGGGSRPSPWRCQRTIRFTASHIRSSPRKRGPRSETGSRQPWILAFAGMSARGASTRTGFALTSRARPHLQLPRNRIHVPSALRPVGGVAGAGGGGAHVHLPPRRRRRARDQGRAARRRLRALLRQARRAADSVCSLPALGPTLPLVGRVARRSAAKAGGVGVGVSGRISRSNCDPHP